jgi:hypothetical protein
LKEVPIVESKNAVPNIIFSKYEIKKSINPRSIDIISLVSERKSLGQTVVIITGQLVKNGTRLVPFERHEITNPFVESYKRQGLIEIASLRFNSMKLKHFQVTKSAETVKVTTFDYVAPKNSYSQRTSSLQLSSDKGGQTSVKGSNKKTKNADSSDAKTLSVGKNKKSKDNFYTQQILKQIQLPIASTTVLSYSKKQKQEKNKKIRRR